jgi:hypothetical protein
MTLAFAFLSLAAISVDIPPRAADDFKSESVAVSAPLSHKALPDSLSQSRDERSDKWRQDIDELGSALRKIHPRFGQCGLPDSLNSQLSSLKMQVDTISDERIVVGLQRILAAVGDGHTLLWPFGMTRGVLLRVPVQLWSFSDGLYVVDASDARLIRKRVSGIGAMTTEQVLERIEPYVSHDNEMQLRWAAPFYATLSDILVAVGATNDRNSVTLRFANGQSETLKATPIDPSSLEIKLIAPKGMSGAKVPRYLTDRDKAFSLETLGAGVIYIRLNAINDMRGQTLAEFGRRLRRPLASARGAILDLRLNSGGDALKADELLKSLIAFDTRGGRIAVLTSRMTFSAAQTLATRLDQWTGAIFIGEPTGSSPNHYGNEESFKLPFSGVRGTISSGFNQPVSSRDQRSTIEPDIDIRLSGSDYFASRDPVLEAAIVAVAKGRSRTGDRQE